MAYNMKARIILKINEKIIDENRLFTLVESFKFQFAAAAISNLMRPGNYSE